MGGLDTSYPFRLKEHTCPKDNTTHQPHVDALQCIINEFYTTVTRKVPVLTKRLEVALEQIHATQLWQRFQSEQPIDRDSFFSTITPWSEKTQSPLACKGCWKARFFYAMAPLMMIQLIQEGFEIPMRTEQTEEDAALCNAALERLDAEINTALNIGLHANELYLE